MELNSLVFQIVISVLVIILGWALNEWRKAKLKLKDAIPGDWLWMAQDFAKVAVRAAYMMFDKIEIEKRLPFAIAWLTKMLAERGFVLTEADQETLRVLIESAWAEFKAELNRDPSLR